MKQLSESTLPSGRILLQSKEWLQSGIEHGFLGKVVGESGDSFITLQQQHTSTVLDFRSREAREDWYQAHAEGNPPVADGFILPSRLTQEDRQFAIITADCLPVFILTDECIAGVHAGWRGLASRILKNALEMLAAEESQRVSVLIGPAAGAQLYQVGGEVIEALGSDAVFQSDGTGKFLLDTVASAIKQIKSVVPHASFTVSSRCTISDDRFHSYRREGPGKGRNYAYLSFKSM